MKIVCIGDSLTYGFPYDPQYSWVRAVEKELGIEMLNKGINGDTTGDMLARFNEDVINHEPNYVLIMGGTNDAYVGVNKNVIQNISTMADFAREKGIKQMIGLVPPVTDASEVKLQEIRSSTIELAKETNIPLLNFYSIFLNEQGEIREEYFCDDCHPNLQGYGLMSKTAVEFFQRVRD